MAAADRAGAAPAAGPAGEAFAGERLARIERAAHAVRAADLLLAGLAGRLAPFEEGAAARGLLAMAAEALDGAASAGGPDAAAERPAPLAGFAPSPGFLALWRDHAAALSALGEALCAYNRAEEVEGVCSVEALAVERRRVGPAAEREEIAAGRILARKAEALGDVLLKLKVSVGSETRAPRWAEEIAEEALRFLAPLAGREGGR